MIKSYAHIPSCKDKPWRICESSNSSMAGYEFKTREEAVEVCKSFWHYEAQKYIWNHRYNRKSHQYPW